MFQQSHIVARADPHGITQVVEGIAAHIERFIRSVDIRSSSRSTYRRSLSCFQGWIEVRGCRQPTREDILAYKGFLQARKYRSACGDMKSFSSQTVSAYLTAVRRFFAWLETEGVYPNIARDIKGLKRPAGFLKEALTGEEVVRLLNGIARTDVISLRDYAIINLMVRTGLRTIEVVRALRDDVGRESGETVLKVWGKGRDSKDEFVILTEEAYTPILDYIQARGNGKLSDPLFLSRSNRNHDKALSTRSLCRIIANRLKAVGLKTAKVTAHSLRHTAGTIALTNGADLLSVKDMLRHSNINTTLTYAHNINRMKKGAEKFIRF